MTSGARVVVIGGGLAGITAAVALAEIGVPVTVLETRPWLGGATWSFGRRGLAIDNGQHVFLRCFTGYRELLARLGVTGSVQIQDRLDVTVLGDSGSARLRRTGLPAPLHLAPMLAGYRTLGISERLGVLPAGLAMWLTDQASTNRDSSSMADWLERHRQGARVRRELWDMFLVPILNTGSDQADIGTAAAVINAVLLSGHNHADLGVARVPLRDLHGAPAVRLLAELGAEVRVGTKVTAIRREAGGMYRIQVCPSDAEQQEQLPLELDDPDQIKAAGVVLAVPPGVASSLVPAELAGSAARWARLKPSPIVSLHVMYDSRVTRLPFALSTGPALRWITDRTKAAGLRAGQYLAASLPAAEQYVDVPAASLRDQFLPEFERLFPAATSARVEDFFVTRERSATFRPGPGTRELRPDQATSLRGFALAGAWTSTGWPDTMEGAVRSGRLAAEVILRAFGSSRRPGSRPPQPARWTTPGRAVAGRRPAADVPPQHPAVNEDDTPTAAIAIAEEFAAELAAHTAEAESAPVEQTEAGHADAAARP